MQVLDSVLLVDDDEAANFFHRSLINKLGLAREIVQTTDGREAYDFINSSYHSNKPLPSLVLLDIAMPQMDGISLIKELQHSDLLGVNKIPISIVSISEQEKYEKDLRILGEYSYITKPLTELKFVDMLQKTIVPYLYSPDKIRFINELHKDLVHQLVALKEQHQFLIDQKHYIEKQSMEIKYKFQRFKDNK